MSLEETRKEAKKQSKFVKTISYKHLSVICKERWEGYWRRCCRGLVTVNDSLLSSVLLSLHPPDWELNSPCLSCGCKAAGQSGCLSNTSVCACPSALVSAVVVHGGWDTGHNCGASSWCKVTCNSWTYRGQEEWDLSTQVWLWERAGLLMVSYNDMLNYNTTVSKEERSVLNFG